MSRTLAVLVALVGLGAPGCFYDLGPFSYSEGPYDGAENSLEAQDPALEGQAGEVTVDEPTVARVYTATRFDNDAIIELRSRGRGGVLMQNYSISGFDRLAPGDEITSSATPYVGTADEPPSDDPADVESVDEDPAIDVFAVGCSGPRDDEWEFDQAADDVTLQVDEGPEPGTLKLTFTSRFLSYYDGEAQTVQGSVVVRVD